MEKLNSNSAVALAASRHREEKACENCGTAFEGLKVSKYCSESCKQKAKYKRSKKISRTVRLSRQLALSRPYDWSNMNIPERVFIILVLKGCYVPDITKCVMHFGGQAMLDGLESLDEGLTKKIASRQLNNVLQAVGSYDA